MGFAVKEGKETRITLEGKLDFARAPILTEALTQLKGKDISTILFECKALTYLSSAGIRAIIFAQQKIAPGMSIIMEDVCDDVVEVLDMCGLSDFIEFTTS
ncbi:MAG: STAS domain-containing protein [Firmicutes bacterium]|nr:STAS domain-containing protein [Bacillota bacterium]